MSETPGKPGKFELLQQLIDESSPLEKAVINIVRNGLHEHAGDYIGGLTYIRNGVAELIRKWQDNAPDDDLEVFIRRELERALEDV